jgi:hypothetical protein
VERIARYSRQKKRAVEMADYIKTLPSNIQTQKLHSEISNCASYLLFRDYYTVDDVRLVAAQTCKKHLLCPFCAGRRASKYVQKGLDKVNEVLNANKSYKPAMITLTVKNGDDLGERWAHLKNAFRALQKRRRDYFARGTGFTEFANVAGGLYAYEVTNKGNGWHPHLHIFALLSDWVDQAKLSSEWLAITGDSSIVGIQRVKPNPKAGGVSIECAMLEVIKYSLKFSDLSLDDTYHAYETLKGRRLLGSFGKLHGVKVPDNLTDDPLYGLPYLERFYRYNKASGLYDLADAKAQAV